MSGGKLAISRRLPKVVSFDRVGRLRKAPASFVAEISRPENAWMLGGMTPQQVWDNLGALGKLRRGELK